MTTETQASTIPSSFPCPTCKQPSTWQDNPHRPFCSARCKDGDFLAWATEKHRIASDDSPLSDILKQAQDNMND